MRPFSSMPAPRNSFTPLPQQKLCSDEPADEVVIDADGDEPQSVRDCCVDPEEPFDEDTVIQLEVQLESMERPLSLMLEHDAVAALSDHDPLKVSLLRLERAMEQASADLARKRSICLDDLQVA